jgi:phosphate:Na+ symporter
MDFSTFSILTFCGAVAIFIYGIRLTRAGVQLLAGDRLRVIISHLTQNRFFAVAIGAFVTLILQSSNAMSITLVGFAASGTISLTQAMGVLLGAGIGGTVVVLFLAIKEISTYSLLFLIAGILVDLFRRGRRSRYVSMILMGVGFIFFGMQLMIAVSSPLQGDPFLQSMFTYISDRPLITLLIAILFTIAVQNSAAPIGLAIALSFSGLIDLKAGIHIVLGANIGICSSSLFASLGSNTFGRRVAFSHLSLKLVGAAVALYLLNPFTVSVEWFGSLLYQNMPDSGLIALSHLLFNIYLVIVFIPCLRPAAWLIEKIIPEPREAEDEKFRPRYLDDKSLEVPSLAFANVRREMLRMLDIDMEMFRDSLTVLEKNDRVLLEAIQNQDDQVDLLDKEIKFYLAKLSQEDLTPEHANMELALIAITSKMEEIGDVINRNVLELADKKIRKARKFSKEGQKEIRDFHNNVQENFKLASASLAAEDESIARRLLRHHEQLATIENECRQEHIQRLHAGRKETFETSSIHLDLISNFYRINELLTQLIREAYPNIV